MDACRHPRLIPTRCYATSFAPLPLFVKGEGDFVFGGGERRAEQAAFFSPFVSPKCSTRPDKTASPGTDSRFLYSENASNANYFVILCANNSLLTTRSILTSKTPMLADKICNNSILP